MGSIITAFSILSCLSMSYLNIRRQNLQIHSLIHLQKILHLSSKLSLCFDDAKCVLIGRNLDCLFAKEWVPSFVSLKITKSKHFGIFQVCIQPYSPQFFFLDRIMQSCAAYA